MTNRDVFSHALRIKGRESRLAITRVQGLFRESFCPVARLTPWQASTNIPITELIVKPPEDLLLWLD